MKEYEELFSQLELKLLLGALRGNGEDWQKKMRCQLRIMMGKKDEVEGKVSVVSSLAWKDCNRVYQRTRRKLKVKAKENNTLARHGRHGHLEL